MHTYIYIYRYIYEGVAVDETVEGTCGGRQQSAVGVQPAAVGERAHLYI